MVEAVRIEVLAGELHDRGRSALAIVLDLRVDQPVRLVAVRPLGRPVEDVRLTTEPSGS